MAHLLILGGPEALKRISIDKEQMVLGRAETVDLCIDDRNASSSHCRIERTKRGYRISDLESQNGTWINGRRVRRKDLRVGDVIAVGTTELRFEGDGDSKPQTVASQMQDREMTRLRKLVSWIRRLTNEHNHEKLLSLMLDSVVELTGAERGFLMLFDKKERARIRVAHDFDLEELRKPTFRVARAIAERVAQRGQPVVSTNADEDPRIQSFGNTGALYLRSVACVPIRAAGRLLGSLYLDNRFERGVLAPEDLPFLLAFADQAAIALENARLHEEATQARAEVEELNTILKGRIEEQEKELHEVSALYAHASAEARTKYSYDAIVGGLEEKVVLTTFVHLHVVHQSIRSVLRDRLDALVHASSRLIHFAGENDLAIGRFKVEVVLFVFSGFSQSPYLIHLAQTTIRVSASTMVRTPAASACRFNSTGCFPFPGQLIMRFNRGNPAPPRQWTNKQAGHGERSRQ